MTGHSSLLYGLLFATKC
uniref:Uncharacterized protein n=1 Tax=Arundo donax TaxID=35708 RepID=A0A0A9AIQ3_ARUDO